MKWLTIWFTIGIVLTIIGVHLIHKNEKQLRKGGSDGKRNSTYSRQSSYSLQGLKKKSLRSSWMKFGEKVELRLWKGVSFELKEGKILGSRRQERQRKVDDAPRDSRDILPDEGRIDTHGREGPALVHRSRLQQEADGQENIYLSGMLFGFTEEQIAEKEQAIIKFASIETSSTSR